MEVHNYVEVNVHENLQETYHARPSFPLQLTWHCFGVPSLQAAQPQWGR